MIKNFVAFVSQLHLFPSYLCLFPSCKLCHLTFSFQANNKQPKNNNNNNNNTTKQAGNSDQQSGQDTRRFL
jgi:hypothetical protein